MGIASQTRSHVAAVNGIELVFETFGDPASPPMLLIMGLGAQMVSWDEAFCQGLADVGFWVIRYDNRDVGRSTSFEVEGVPDLMAIMQAALAGEAVTVPYTLDDMARDAVGLLDVLGVQAAHLVGASMGGMIAQLVAIHFPERVLTLTSIMSTTGDPTLPPPEPQALTVLFTPAPPDREGAIDHTLATLAVLSPQQPLDPDYLRGRAALAYDRRGSPTGGARQLAAVLASGSRTQALQQLRCPTLVIHGDADPLIPVAAGYATAAAVPGATQLIIPGMGHAMPPVVWPQLIEAIVSHAHGRGSDATA